MTTVASRVIDHLKTNGGLKHADVANIFGVSRPTVSRWVSGSASPSIQNQTVIADLRYVVDLLRDMYEPDEIRLWLHARNELLEGRSANELIMNGETSKVIEAIESMNACAYL